VTVVACHAGAYEFVICFCYEYEVICFQFFLDDLVRVVVWRVVGEDGLPEVYQGGFVLGVVFADFYE